MATNQCLGIYCASDRLVAVLADRKQRSAVSPSVTVCYDELTDEQQGDMAALCELLAQKVREQFGKGFETVATLDSCYYQNQSYVSQFEDMHQIRQTIRFDIEEEFAIEAERVKVAYRPINTPQPGTKLMVYTADTAAVTALLEGLERVGLDAVAVEPEMESWFRWLETNSQVTSESVIYLGRCGGLLYLIIKNKDGDPVVMRSFPAPEEKDFAGLTAAEIKRCVISLEQMPERIYVQTDQFDRAVVADLGQRLNLQIQPLPEVAMETALAASAGEGWLHHELKVDFRQDNLPSRTMFIKENRALWGAAVAACVFLLVWIVGAYSHQQAYKSFVKKTQGDILTAWRKAMPNRSVPKANMDKIMETELRQLKRQYSGEQVEYVVDSASRTLTSLLQFLNQVPEEIDLQIEKMGMNSEGVYAFSGSVKSLEAFDKLREILRQSKLGLSIDRSSFEPPNGSTRSFSMPLKLSMTAEKVSYSTKGN